MEITRLDLDDRATLGELTELFNAAERVDAPWVHEESPEQVRGTLAYAYDLEGPVCFVGRSEGTFVAFGGLHTSSWDNKELAWLVLSVHPDHRRRGHGSRMLEHLEKAAAELGRTKLGTQAWDGTPGTRFAESHGYVAKSRAINRRQHLDELDLDEARALHARAAQAASDYDVLRLLGPIAEEQLSEFAEVSASINDAPLDDLDMEDDNFDPQRIRHYEEASGLRQRTLYRVVARHRPSGRLVAHSTLVVERLSPAVADQHDTAVMPEHRGHRLGLLLKTEMVLWLAEAEPQLRTIDTWNAESNDHMIRVNEALHYRWMGRELQYQK